MYIVDISFLYQVLVEVSLVTIGFAPENGGGSIIGVQHLPELEAVCFATAKGDVNLYNTAVKQVCKLSLFIYYS